jgi:FkbM family methyltransferase
VNPKDLVVEFDAGVGRPLRITGDARDTSVMAVMAGTGGYEPDIVAVLRRVVRRDSVVLDVGANIGVHTVTAATLCPDGHVYAFEPSSHHARYLRRNVAENQLPNVTVEQVAVMHEAGTVEVNMPETYQAGAYIAAGHHEGVVETVTADSLDAWAERAGVERCDLLKLDVEGCERLVLAGGRRSLARWQPLLLVECNAVTQRRFRHESLAPLFDDLRTFAPAMYAIGAGGRLDRVLSAGHLDRRATDGGLVDVLCVPPPRRDTVAGGGSVVAALRNDFRLRARFNRWRRPAHAIVHDPSYRLEVTPGTLEMARGERTSLAVTVHNTGRLWLSDAYEPNPARLSYRWVRDGAIVDGVGGPRTSFGSLRPGAHRRVELDVVADREPGSYELDVGVVQEDFAWLVDLAPDCRCRIPVTVT